MGIGCSFCSRAAAVTVALVFAGSGSASAAPIVNFAKVSGVGVLDASDYNPMSGYGLFSTKSASKDETVSDKTGSRTSSVDGAVYAGGGIEPMAFTQAAAAVQGNKAVKYSTYIQAEVQWSHWVESLPGAPEVDYVPATLDFRIGQDESNGIAYAQLVAKTCWPSPPFASYLGCADASINRTWEASAGKLVAKQWSYFDGKYHVVDYVDHLSLSVQLSPGAEEVIYLKAKSTVALNTYAEAGPIVTTSHAQSIIDPLLAVDPSWEYASYFRILQRKSLTDSSGIEVTRDWMPAEVPEPSSIALIAAGLACVVGACRRRTR